VDSEDEANSSAGLLHDYQDRRKAADAALDRRSMGQGVMFPLQEVARKHHSTVRTLVAPGYLKGRLHNSLYFLFGPAPGGEGGSVHFQKGNFTEHLGRWICLTQSSFAGSRIPEPASGHTGSLKYHAKDLDQIVLERIMCQAPGAGPSTGQPTVRMFRCLTITHPDLPGCVLRLRACPFAAYPFRGRVRGDYFCSIPEGYGFREYSTEHLEKDEVHIGQLIALFQVLVRQKPGTDPKVYTLAYVSWLDRYQADPEHGSVVDKHFKTHKLYRPTKPWYGVIDAWRILAMEPLVPDFSNNGKVPRTSNVKQLARHGAVGNDLFVRARMARFIGRHRAFIPAAGEDPV
jgi:hypothetical protein